MRAGSAVRRRVGAAAVTALVAGGTVLAGAAPAVAADPPTNRIAIASWYYDQAFDLLTDDAVYAHHAEADDAGAELSRAIFRMPITTDGTGTTVGAPEFVAEAAPHTDYAEHDGSIAYLRASDSALVLRAPDGSETVLTWATPEMFSNGVHGLTTDSVVGAINSRPAVFTLSTGAELDLLDMSHVPNGAEWAAVREVAITDDRVVWVTRSDVYPPGYSELLTVGLADGTPVGTATTIGLVTRDTWDFVTPFTEPAIVGDRVLWQYVNATGAGSSTLKWRAAAPYDGTPQTLALPSRTRVAYTQDHMVLNTWGHHDDAYGTPLFSASWRALANPGTTVWSTGTVTGSFRAAAGSLYVYTQGEGRDTAWLADASGRPVRAEGWIPPIMFTDVNPDDVFGTEIMWFAQQGLTTGYPDGTFRREGTVKRDSMAAFLYRITHDGADAPDCTEAAFTDVPASHPFCGEIAWLAGTGITTGWPDGTFRPAQAVSRQAMAAFLFRLHRINNPSTPVTPCDPDLFVDVSTGNSFCGAITWLADSGVSTGWPDHTFRPGGMVARQAMAAFLYRFVENGLLFAPR